MNEIDKFTEALKKYRDGEIQLDELEVVFQETGQFEHFRTYLNESDLRAQDADYSVMQEKALAHFMKLLRSRDFEAANGVTFKDKI